MAKGTGNKPKYTTPEEMQEAIDSYFIECDGVIAETIDSKGNKTQTLNKWGEPVRIGFQWPTMRGLALALGFSRIETMDNYANKNAAYKDVVTRARTRVLERVEQAGFLRDSAQGATKYLAAHDAMYRQTKAEEPEKAPIKIEISVVK